MLRTASIKLEVTPDQFANLAQLQAAYANACNSIVPIAIEHRCWNRVALHNLTYRMVRESTPLGSQMVCNAIFSVCKAFRSMKEHNKTKNGASVPAVRFKRTSVHFDKRTYSLKGDSVSLYTLNGRITARLRLGEHQRRIIEGGIPKEADLVFRKKHWYFNVVIESQDQKVTNEFGLVVGVDVGENNLAAISTGKVFGGEQLRDQRDRHLALRRRLQSNGSQRAKQKLRQISGKEARRVKHINHETSKAIVAEVLTTGASKITMENLTHIRTRIKVGKRMRGRLHRWAWRQLQAFIEYKASTAGIEVEYVNPAYTSQTCSNCGSIGKRIKHRFECLCGLRAHADLNASRNLARIGEAAVSPRAAVNTPDVGCVAIHASP
jgi:IS605 OrfB family transposase